MNQFVVGTAAVDVSGQVLYSSTRYSTESSSLNIGADQGKAKGASRLGIGLCEGTTSCAHYENLCNILPWYHGGWAYYCGPGNFLCNNIGVLFGFVGLTQLENCIRKCLQDRDVCPLLWDATLFGACINVLHVQCYAECFNNPVCRAAACVREPCDAIGFVWSTEECQCVPQGSSPIIITARGNQLQLTNARTGVNFDLDADGVPERTSWLATGADGAFLVLDRNGNGRIDDGTELFGEHAPQAASNSPNGFLALRVFDEIGQGGNEDGKISRADSVFGRLALWNDASHDGVSQIEEMIPLSETDIIEIDLDYKESKRTDEFGNQFRYLGKVKVNAPAHAPKTKLAVDVFFVGLPRRYPRSRGGSAGGRTCVS